MLQNRAILATSDKPRACGLLQFNRPFVQTSNDGAPSDRHDDCLRQAFDEPRKQCATAGLVERSYRLIQEENSWRSQQRSSQCGALLFAAGQLGPPVGFVVQAFGEVVEPYRFHDRSDSVVVDIALWNRVSDGGFECTKRKVGPLRNCNDALG